MLGVQDGAGVAAFLTRDHLGSIREHVNSAGDVTLRRDYDPWGRISAGGAVGGWAYTGRENEAEIQFYYYRARYYDPAPGRFASPDPIAALALRGTFAYVSNNPIRYLDPSGLKRLSYDEVRQYVIDNNLSSQTDALIICLIWKESAFDSDARAAGSSATGLMQMTRAAAQDAGFKHSDMTDPAQNIQAGSKYLQMRIRAANGSKKAGLELYGTGPGYADDILCCEQCMLRPNPNTGGCLAIIHE